MVGDRRFEQERYRTDRDHFYSREQDQDRDRRPEGPRHGPIRRHSEYSSRDMAYSRERGPGAHPAGSRDDSYKESPAKISHAPSSVRSDVVSDNGQGRNSPLIPSKTTIGLQDSHIRKVTDILCEKLFWYIRKDTADTKRRKLFADLEKCKFSRSDFTSAFDLLSMQKRIADEDREKCRKRLQEAEDKLIPAVQYALQKLSGHLVSNDVIMSTAAELGSSASTKVPAVEDFEARLAAAQQATNEKFTRQLEEQTENLKQVLQLQYDVQMSELKARLDSEYEQNNQLQSRIEKLEEILEFQHAKQLSELKTRLESGDEKNNQLQTKVEQVEETLTSKYGTHISELKHRLDSENLKNTQLQTKIEQSEKSIHSHYGRQTQELQLKNSQLQTEIKQVSQKLEAVTSRQETSRPPNSDTVTFIKTTMDRLGVQEAKIASVLLQLDTLSETMITPAQIKQNMAENIEHINEALISRTSPADTEARREINNKVGLIEEALKNEQAKTATYVQDMKRYFTDLTILKSQLTSFEATMKAQDEKYSATYMEVVSLRNAVSTIAKHGHPAPPEPLLEPGKLQKKTTNPSGSMSERQVLEIIAPRVADMETRLQGSFKTVAEKFGKFIDKERQEREELQKAIDEVTSSVSSMRKDVDVVKPKLVELGMAFNEQVNQHRRAADWQQQSYQSLFSAVEHTKNDSKAHIDALSLQMQCMDAWQRNFTTKELYNEIVEHINATLPHGVVKQLRVLATKMEAVEGRLQTDDTGAIIKKRKLYTGELT